MARAPSGSSAWRNDAEAGVPSTVSWLRVGRLLLADSGKTRTAQDAFYSCVGLRRTASRQTTDSEALNISTAWQRGSM